MTEPARNEIEGLWRESIAPALSLPRQMDWIEPGDGFGTKVIFVHTADGADYSLRMYARASASRLKNYLRSNRALADLGHRVPRIHGQGQSRHWYWLLEEKIPGANFRELLDSPQAVGQAAAALARLHSTQRGRYGDRDGWGGFRLTLRWKQRFEERWNKVLRLFPETRTVTDPVTAWFSDWADRYEPAPYQLLHGDYHPGNLCLTPEGEVAFFDLRTPRYGLGLLELIEAAHHFTGEEPVDWRPFVAAYMRERNVAVRNLYEAWEQDLHAIFHLRHADRFADLAIGQRGEIEDRRRWERNAWDSLLRFLQYAGLPPPEVDIQPESAFARRGVAA